MRLRDDKDYILIGQGHWSDGDEEGEEPLIELMEEVAGVPSRTEHKSSSIMNDVAYNLATWAGL